MGTQSQYYLGIDLGTTNSAAAIFDGQRLESVRNPQGATLTPSVVRCDARGNLSVGARARAAAERDPENVHSEFKRLMGSPHKLSFGTSPLTFAPERLAAEVLRALRFDVQSQLGISADCAVIGVPALFELPQTAATSEAARLAGFERVEIIQEPVAAALAAGWKAEATPGAWLVYDIGGGTFDVTLLETQEGLLRVVGHDGDNFLGGRDFDSVLVDWAISAIATQHGIAVDRANPAHRPALRRLRVLAEETKIELSRAHEAELIVNGLEIGGQRLDTELLVARTVFERLIEPFVARSLLLCRKLLAAHGIVPGSGALSRIVLVGGPTAVPYLRARLAETLATDFAPGLDPMTLVAQGAALFAASANLGVCAAATPSSPAPGPRVWLQYPAMTSDLTPFVVGRVSDSKSPAAVAKIVIRREDGAWSSLAEPLDSEGAFATMLSLVPRTTNRLIIEGRAADDDATCIALSPGNFQIIHGVTLGDPPLARSVGIALADNSVRVFFERGSPLPMRRTFTLHTAEALHPEDSAGKLLVPIVQGEFPLAHLCRLVGNLEIHARDLRQAAPAGSRLEVTLELDRGGRVSSSARLPHSEQLFDGVAHLSTGEVPILELGKRLSELSQRAQALRTRAVKTHTWSATEALGPVHVALAGAFEDEQRARGGDQDALEKARRGLLDVDAAIANAEAELAWPELDAATSSDITSATYWLTAHGTDAERKSFTASLAAIDRARTAKSPEEVQRHAKLVQALGTAAYLRHPGAWETLLDHASGLVAESSDPVRAQQLVRSGRQAIAVSDKPALEHAVRSLWSLLPVAATERALAHGSGVR